MGKIDIEIIEKLAELMEKKNLSYLEVEEDSTKISLSREISCIPAQEVATASCTSGSETSSIPASTAPQKEGEALISPLVGVAYLSPAPGESSFVSVGSHVKKGDQLCILEAMKVMNEFNAPRDGVIVEICVSDGDTVEYGQPIFRLK